MNRNIKLTIEYDGTRFSGWQTQTARGRRTNPSLKCPRTVQGEIERALKKIFGKDIKLKGSGRTDSGVHAQGQVANFKTTSTMPTEEMCNALNANLPEDVAILSVEEVGNDFHAQYSAKSKTYRYTILNHATRCALKRNYCLHYPYTLNIRKMREEAKSLVGRKDFKSFAASDPAMSRGQALENQALEKNTIRTIKRLTITKKGLYLNIEVEANGFLYKMVRNIVGTLLEVGRGKLAKKGSIKDILTQKNRNAAGYTVKAKGLTLVEVRY